MATPAQILANRANALKSTGPRSAEGKAAVRFNALKHGVEAESAILPGEDPDEFDDLRLDYHRQFQPQGPVETFLVETIVHADWAQRRLIRLEADFFRHAMSVDPALTPGAVFAQDAAGPNVFQKLFRRQQAAQREWHRAIAELRRLQQERTPDSDDFADLPEPAPALSIPPEPPWRTAPAAVSPLNSREEFGSVPATRHAAEEQPKIEPPLVGVRF